MGAIRIRQGSNYSDVRDVRVEQLEVPEGVDVIRGPGILITSWGTVITEIPPEAAKIPGAPDQASERSVRCAYLGGRRGRCKNMTRDPSGMCWIHQSQTQTQATAVPEPAPDAGERVETAESAMRASITEWYERYPQEMSPESLVELFTGQMGSAGEESWKQLRDAVLESDYQSSEEELEDRARQLVSDIVKDVTSRDQQLPAMTSNYQPAGSPSP